jgi:hypothetical protein
METNQKNVVKQCGECGVGWLYSSFSHFQFGHTVQSQTHDCCQVYLAVFFKPFIFLC